MGIVDILGELLTTALIDQDTNNKKGCSPWFWIFLIAIACYVGYLFLIKE